MEDYGITPTAQLKVCLHATVNTVFLCEMMIMMYNFYGLQIGMQPIHLAASGDRTRIVDILVDEYHVDPQAKVNIYPWAKYKQVFA